MKNIFYGVLFFLGAAAVCSAAGIAEEAEKGNKRADMSYAFGMLVASDLAEAGLEFNYAAFGRGFREYMEGQETRFTVDEAIEIVDAAFMAAQADLAEQNRIAGETFLAQNAARPGVVVTPSGLQYEAISEGDGETPAPDDIVLVHYRGATTDGIVFDSSYERDFPMEIPLDRVIPGWAEGLRMMREGGKAKLYIPPDLAYGENGAGGVIGPNAVLIFDVELLTIVRDSEEDSFPQDSFQ